MRQRSNHGRSHLAGAAVFFLGAALLFAFPACAATKPGYLKSATYAGDEWVINFWNSETDHLDEDMARIASDGFNSIILVVPWGEFQTQLRPAAYSTYAFDKLDAVMDAAAAHGLWVQLRVSYTWNYADYENCKKRFRSLLEDADTREAWAKYMERVYQAASAHDNFYGGFITWEDFWNFMEDSVSTLSGSRNVGEAKLIGYQDYLREHYSLEEVNRWYQPSRSFRTYSSVYIPPVNSPARKLYYEFYDDFLNGMLKLGQSVFPGLSMEVRMDVDPVPDGNGGKTGVSHAATFACGDAAYTGAMYSVSMGQDANVELTGAQALNTMISQLAWVKSENGGKPIYIDQLLYMDATERFSYNARLQESERAAYLTGLPPVLKKYTNGYGIWSYRNYVNNPLYNSQFALKDRGWETSRAHFVRRGDSMAAHLEPMGRLSQKCGGRIEDKEERDNYVRFTADSDQVVTLTVALGTRRKEVRISGRGDHLLNFGKLDYDQIAFTADGDVYLDNVQVYNFVQDGQLYDQDGNALSCLEAMRTLNAAMN